LYSQMPIALHWRTFVVNELNLVTVGK
jgi:hypothetical protein